MSPADLISVKVTTLLDTTITGTIYAYDPITSSLTLITSTSPNGTHDVRILKVSFLRDVAVLATAPKTTFSDATPKISRVNAGRVVAAAAAREQKIGKGVSKEGQDIFDALSRTMPCRWADKSIVVLETVMIGEPYGVDSVRGNDQNAVKRVKKVVSRPGVRVLGLG